MLGLLDVSFSGGLIKGDKLIEFIRRHFVDHDFAALGKPFACVATDLESGREIWLREGSVVEAVRASIAIPGLFTPRLRDGRLLGTAAWSMRANFSARSSCSTSRLGPTRRSTCWRIIRRNAGNGRHGRNDVELSLRDRRYECRISELKTLSYTQLKAGIIPRLFR